MLPNFFRLRLIIEKQEGKRKYKSDGAVMVGEFVCMYVCSCTVSEWVRSEWVSEGGREWGSECVWVSEWVGGWVSEWMSEWVSDCHACHAKAAEPQGTPGRTSDPLAVHIVPRLPRKRGGAPRGTPGRTSDPLAVQIVPRQSGGAPRDARAYIRPLGSAHCPTTATQKRSPKGRQGVHPTLWQCTLSHACHAKEAEPQGTPGRTSDPLAVHIVPRLPRKSGGAPRDARAYIRPLGSAHCPTPATQKRRSPKGRQGVHQTPWQCTLSHACHAKAAEPQGTPGRTSDPLAVHIVPRLPRKRGGAPRDARAYIRPLGSANCPTTATQKRRSPNKRQGVHPTPWQCTLSHACHAKEADPQGTPGRTSDPLAVHIVPRLPRKRGKEWVSEWVCWVCWVSWVSWVSECVSEEDRRASEEDRRARRRRRRRRRIQN